MAKINFDKGHNEMSRFNGASSAFVCKIELFFWLSIVILKYSETIRAYYQNFKLRDTQNLLKLFEFFLFSSKYIN